jgi:tRNA threonylcarbamoyladenosine biosynthesis protein TsaB
MNVLAIDTAGPVVGVALLVGDALSMRTERVLRGSETRIATWASELCLQAGIAVADLDGVAVSRGPGAFTGLRVGLSTALGIAHGVGCPVIAESSLLSRARRTGQDRVLSMLDARKSRVYAMWTEDGGRSVSGGPADVSVEEAMSWASGSYVATGEGALAYQDVLTAAGITIVAAADSLERGEGMRPAEVTPVYLRRPDARTIAERAAAKQGVTPPTR